MRLRTLALLALTAVVAYIVGRRKPPMVIHGIAQLTIHMPSEDDDDDDDEEAPVPPAPEDEDALDIRREIELIDGI